MVKSDLPDNDLWKEFQSGDDGIITIIYRKYANELYDYGLKIINDGQMVQDCIQEIFIHLIDKRKVLLITTNIRNYLYKSLRNKIMEEWRTENRKQNVYQTVVYESETALADIESEILREEESLRIEKELLHVLNSLTTKQMEIIFLKFTKGVYFRTLFFDF